MVTTRPSFREFTVPLPAEPSSGPLSAQQVDQINLMTSNLKINYPSPPHTQIHEMIIHQTLIREMILAALLLPNVPPPACWACWPQPVASWPSGFTDPGCKAGCWSLKLACSEHSSGALPRPHWPSGPWHCPSLGWKAPVQVVAAWSWHEPLWPSVWPTQMPLLKSVMTRAFTSFRRNSFSRWMLCVQDSLMAAMRTVS